MNNSCLNIFGSSFTFTVFTHKQYKTIIGTICSIITIIILIIFAFLFGEDILFRQNPITISSKHKPVDYTFFPMNKDILSFPWRLNDYSGNAVDYRKYIYPVFLYEKYLRDPLTKVVTYSNETLKYSQCKPNPSIEDIDLSKYNCFDFDELTLGGNHDINSFFYLSFFLAYCPDGNKYIPDGSCNEDNILELNNILSNDNYWSFSFIYPEHNFEPITKDEPLRIIYKQHSIKLNLHLSKIEHFTFQYVNMNDDQGVLYPNDKKYSKFAIFDHSIDFFYTDYLFTEESSSIFYRINFYMSKDSDEYTRRYIKLPEVVANISGFLKVIMLVFEFICFTVNDSFFYSSLLFTFFSFEEKKKICLTDISHVIDQENDPSVNVNIPIVIMMNKDQRKQSITPKKKMNIISSSIEKKRESPVQFTPIKLNEKTLMRDRGMTMQHVANLILCPCLVKKKERSSEKYQSYVRALKAIKARLDITEYIRLINEGQLMKKELLKEDQVKQMNTWEKINCFDNNIINSLYGNPGVLYEIKVKEKSLRHKHSQRKEKKPNNTHDLSQMVLPKN